MDAYFDEEAHECVFADGVECFETGVNIIQNPDDRVTIGVYSEWCCHNRHANDKPYYNYFTYKCVSSCPNLDKCVPRAPSEPEVPLFNVPTCIAEKQYADCTECGDGRTLNVTSGTCRNVEATDSVYVKLVAFMISLCLSISVLFVVGCCWLTRAQEQTLANHTDPSMMYPSAPMHAWGMSLGASMPSKSPGMFSGASKHAKSCRMYLKASMPSKSSMMYPGAWMRESMHPVASMHSKSRKKHRGAPMRSKSRKKHRGAPMRSKSPRTHDGV